MQSNTIKCTFSTYVILNIPPLLQNLIETSIITLFTVGKLLAVTVYIHITLDGTLSLSCLFTTCFVIYI